MPRLCLWLVAASCFTCLIVHVRAGKLDVTNTPGFLESLDTLIQQGMLMSAAASPKEAGDLLQVLRSVQERRLTSGPDPGSCSKEAVVLLAGSAVTDFTTCVVEGYTHTNMSIPGQDTFVYAQCWCRHNMTEVMGPAGLNCCGTSEYQWLCSLNCSLLDNPSLEAICTEEGSRAKRCTEECSSMCLEVSYPTTPGCTTCAEDNCSEYMFCLEWHTWQKHEQGEVSLVCNERQFDNSLQVDHYWRCAALSGTNTNWQRYNLHSHCMCDADLKQAASDAYCCGHGENDALPWAVEYCEAECLSQTDCRTDRAKQCLLECADLCHIVDPRFFTKECWDHCIASDAPCQKYRTCPPQDPEPFTYICDDGSLPSSNGCCEGLLANGEVRPTCPLSCSAGRAYYLSHGVECSCYECQESQIVVDLVQRGNETVAQALYENGVQVLSVVAKQAGLRNGWPTADMVSLMNQRNFMIMDIIAVGERGSRTALDVQLGIHAVSMSYNNRISDLARRGGYEPLPEHGSSSRVEVRRRGVPLYIMVVVLSMSIGAMLIMLGLRVFIISRRNAALERRKQEQVNTNLLQQGYGHAMQPGLRATAGEDLTIVVGQPVCQDGQQLPKGAAIGSPLCPGPKGGEKVPMVEYKKGASSTSLKEAWT